MARKSRIAENAMKLYEVEKGACVVLDAKNGEIRFFFSLLMFASCRKNAGR